MSNTPTKTKKDAPDHSEREHAEFSPSQLASLESCPGYENHNESSEAAEMGTRIHEALEAGDPSHLLSDREHELYDAIREMEDELVTDWLKDDPYATHLEMLLDIKAKDQETYGSCDKLIVQKNAALLIDYKTGISEITPPEQNLQAQAYSLGVFQKFPQITAVTFAFIIPQHDLVLRGIFHREDCDALEQRIAGVISRAEVARRAWEKGTPDEATLRPGSVCDFCKHVTYCPAVSGLALKVAHRLGVEDLPESLDPEFIHDPKQLATAYRVAKVLDKWGSAVRGEALNLAKAGVELPGFELRSMGRPRKIQNLQSALTAFADLGLDVHEVLEICSMTLDKLGRAVSAKAPRGQKGTAKDNALQLLEDEGFIAYDEERFGLFPEKK